MKVVVTGANGFLGSWLCKSLQKKGFQVSALVRKNSDLTELNDFTGSFAYGDVTDLESLVVAFKDSEAVFHLAGVVAYKKSERDLMEKVNVQGTENVLSAMKHLGIKKLLHVSSVVAVGAGFSKTEVLNEESKFNLDKLKLGYFETKLKAEIAVKEATAKGEVSAVIVNPSTIYGPGDAKKGSRKTQVKVARGKFPFYTSGGVNVVHIEDVVEGIYKAFKIGRVGERYVLSGENITIKKLFQMIASESQVSPPKIKMPDTALHFLGFIGDQLQKLGIKSSLSAETAWTATLFHWFSSDKAERELGFKSRPAKDAIQESVLWMKKNNLL